MEQCMVFCRQDFSPGLTLQMTPPLHPQCQVVMVSQRQDLHETVWLQVWHPVQHLSHDLISIQDGVNIFKT